jgi:calnexin
MTVHFILRWRHPVSGVWEEHHLSNAPRPKNDRLPHVYTLVLRPDASFTIKIDNAAVRSGSLYADFAPSLIPDKEVDDPTDTKPADWVDAAEIDDPEATVRAGGGGNGGA